jgi:hypothetical protein
LFLFECLAKICEAKIIRKIAAVYNISNNKRDTNKQTKNWNTRPNPILDRTDLGLWVRIYCNFVDVGGGGVIDVVDVLFVVFPIAPRFLVVLHPWYLSSSSS